MWNVRVTPRWTSSRILKLRVSGTVWVDFRVGICACFRIAVLYVVNWFHETVANILTLLHVNDFSVCKIYAVVYIKLEWTSVCVGRSSAVRRARARFVELQGQPVAIAFSKRCGWFGEKIFSADKNRFDSAKFVVRNFVGEKRFGVTQYDRKVTPIWYNWYLNTRCTI